VINLTTLETTDGLWNLDSVMVACGDPLDQVTMMWPDRSLAALFGATE
jgi:hypothetical protein